MIRRYEASWLPKDLVAGITLGVLMVPVGLAFGELAGVPMAGLYAGMLPLVAYNCRSEGIGVADASFLWHLKDLAAIKDQAIYAGFGLQAAGLFDRVDPVADGEVYGVSAYLAGPTPIGTFTLGFGAADDSWSIFLSLGRPIGKGSILDDGLFR